MAKLCVIPARGGSKRILHKNTRFFRGKPIIAWSIEAAIKAGCFDDIIVSTDNIKIAEVALAYGANVPFLRPDRLADDHASTMDVMSHAVDWALSQLEVLTAVCCLYATAPFVQPNDLLQAAWQLERSRAGTVLFTATSFPFPIERAIHLDPDGYATSVNPEAIAKRSQDFKEAFHDAGQFYWARPERWNGSSNLFDGSRPLLLPRRRGHDIDTEEDWHRAELIHTALGQNDIHDQFNSCCRCSSR